MTEPDDRRECAQRLPMKPDADLSPYGIASIVDSFLEALDLSDVTIAAFVDAA